MVPPQARAGQFFRALGARRRPPDPAPATRVLSPALLALFLRMPAEDQRHGLAVMAMLEADGQAEPLLLQAGLLHDVGKSDGGVGLRHRVARVLLRAGAPRAWRWLSGAPEGWRRPYWVVAHHPDRGAAWIDAAGGDPRLVALVRFHERRPPADWAGTELACWHAALAAADARD